MRSSSCKAAQPVPGNLRRAPVGIQQPHRRGARAAAEDQQAVRADAAVALADDTSEGGNVLNGGDLALLDEEEVVAKGVALNEVHSSTGC